jgi:hypothetical protein
MNLTVNAISKMEIPLPPIDVQRRSRRPTSPTSRPSRPPEHARCLQRKWSWTNSEKDASHDSIVRCGIYVHGISQHDSGYSDAWYDALRPHLGRPLEKHEVRWSDLVNAPRMMATEASATKLDEEERLRREIQAELESRKARNGQVTPGITRRNAGNQYQASSFALDDFVRYMVWESTRNSILSRFDDIALPLLKAGYRLHVITHSWGTVVAYEGLRHIDHERPAGRVANLITLCSALSIGTVQRNLFGRVSDGRLPQVVDAFINVDAGGDIVGGPIAPPFEITEEYLNKRSTGCQTFWFYPRTARDFLCAHSSYFDPKNTAVNRSIVAHYINNALAKN